MIHVVATIELVEGTASAKSSSRVPPHHHIVQDEDGCIEYGPTIDEATSVSSTPARENVVVVVEDASSVPARGPFEGPPYGPLPLMVKDIVRDVKIAVLKPA